MPTEECSRASQQENNRRNGVADAGLTAALALGAAIDLVGGHANEGRHRLRECEVAPVAVFAQIGGYGYGGRAVCRDGGRAQDDERGRCVKGRDGLIV